MPTTVLPSNASRISDVSGLCSIPRVHDYRCISAVFCIMEMTRDIISNCSNAWALRKSNQSILMEINPEYQFLPKNWCWSWSSNTLATWCKQQIIGKDLDAGKDWRQKEKEAAYDEMVRQHYGLNEHEFDQTQGDSGRQRCLVFYSPWGCKELAQLNDWTVTMTTVRTQDCVPISKCWSLQRPFALWGTIFTDAGG